jgi:O-antigen/teichoic acid export membrane protein
MKRVPGVKFNLAANLFTKTLTGVLGLVLVPIYVHLIGIYVSLSALTLILDLGLTATINREMARLSATEGAEQEARDLVRSLEPTYWSIGVVVGLAIMLLAPAIAHHWVHAKSVPPQTVERAIMLMGILFAFQWPDSFYAGGLLGRQRQIAVNGIRIGVALLQACGAVLILKYVSATIIAFLSWQILIFGLQTLLLGACLWRSLPAQAMRPRFRREIWIKNSRFTAGVTAISLTAVALTQLDKVILSHQLSLKEFGYYALATSLASNLLYPIAPLIDALFPRLVQLTVQNDPRALAIFYHKSCQLLSLIILPIWAVAALFAHPLLSLYLHDATIVENVYRLFSLLVTSTALNALVILPYQLQLAHGQTKLVFHFNLAALFVLIPVIPWVALHYGAIGAAGIQIGINAIYIFFLIPLMYRRVLPGETWRWYILDIGRPLLVSGLIGLLARVLMPTGMPLKLVLFYVLPTMAVALIACALATPFFRHRLHWKGQVIG